MEISSFEKLVLNDERLRVFNDTVPAGILVLSVDSGRVVFSNRFFNEIIGVEGSNVLGDSWESFFLDAQERQDLMVKFVEEEVVRNHELRLKRPNGDIVWGLVSMSDIPIENEDLLLFAFVDITALKKAEEEIRQLANHDALTGLPSLRLLQDRIAAAISRARRDDTEMAVLFVDLDGFKAVNDTLGHDAGDAVLKDVGERLRACVRESDTAARMGGDEFVIVLERMGSRDRARQIGERIVEHLGEPFTTPSGDAHIGASVGIALFPADGDTPDALIKAADGAMYEVKKTTKGAVTFA